MILSLVEYSKLRLIIAIVETQSIFYFQIDFLYLQNVLNIANDFLKLEKLESCGTTGRVLSSQIEDVYEDFKEAFKMFSENSAYDPLDPDSDQFEKDLLVFDEFMDDLDNRLASIACSTFENCTSVDACFKVSDERAKQKKTQLFNLVCF